MSARTCPSLHVEGTADLYPDDQLVLVANGLRRFSRPIFQSYSAYTPRLIALNEGHLRRADRPRTIFVDLAPIDGRWPSSEDGPNLVTILSDYRLAGRTSPSTSYSSRSGGPGIGPSTAHRAFSILSHRRSGDRVWSDLASIDVRRTLLGKLEELAFRPARLFLDQGSPRVGASGTGSFRASGRIGFLLSPYLADRGALAAMATPEWRRVLAGCAVRSITVRAHRDRLHGYADDVGRVVLPCRDAH